MLACVLTLKRTLTDWLKQRHLLWCRRSEIWLVVATETSPSLGRSWPRRPRGRTWLVQPWCPWRTDVETLSRCLPVSRTPLAQNTSVNKVRIEGGYTDALRHYTVCPWIGNVKSHVKAADQFNRKSAHTAYCSGKWCLWLQADSIRSWMTETVCAFTGPTKSHPEPSGRRPEPSGHRPDAARTLYVGLRCPEPYSDRHIKRENARESGCS